jgi:hypothetical protein
MTQKSSNVFSIGRKQRCMICLSTRLETMVVTCDKWYVSIFFFVCIPILSIGISIAKDFKYYQKELHVFVWLDFIALVIALILSSVNYKNIINDVRGQIIGATNGSRDWYLLITERFYEQVFLILNFTFFCFAIATLLFPLWELFLIQIIYFTFSLNNHFQAKLSIQMTGDNLARGVQRTLDLNHWFNGENGPAVIGYSVVISIVFLLVWKGDEINIPFFCNTDRLHALRSDWKPIFVDIIEAMAAGVAGYHIALSTISFKRGHNASAARLLEIEPAINWVKDPSFVAAVKKQTAPDRFLILIVASVVISLSIMIYAQLNGLQNIRYPNNEVVKGGLDNPNMSVKIQTNESDIK